VTTSCNVTFADVVVKYAAVGQGLRGCYPEQCMCAAADRNSAVTPDFTSWQQSMPPLLCAGPASRAEMLRPACCVTFSLAFAQHSARQLHVHPATGLADAAADARVAASAFSTGCASHGWPPAGRMQQPGAAAGIPPTLAHCRALTQSASLPRWRCPASAATACCLAQDAGSAAETAGGQRAHSWLLQASSKLCLPAAGCAKCCRLLGL
jgi:hypothetical protein